MFVVALLLCCPGLRICIFSTGKRASSSLMLEVTSIITRMGHADRVVKRNQEQLFLSQTPRAEGVSASSEKAKALSEGGAISKLYSFPAGTAGKYPAYTDKSREEGGCLCVVYAAGTCQCCTSGEASFRSSYTHRCCARESSVPLRGNRNTLPPCVC